nr:zinc finger BED domain-containing protein RICESLEEPER 2-like [Ipomoea batatas]
MDGRMVLFIFLLLFFNFGVCLVRGGVFIFDLGILDFSIAVACLRSEVLFTHPGKPRGIPQFSPLATTHVICCVLGVTAFVRQRVAGDLGQSDGRRLGSYNEQTAGTTGARCQVIDNAFAPTAKKKKYGDSLKDMQDMLSEFFDKIHAGRSVLCAGIVPKRMQMPWRDFKNKSDYGVYLMRHMETFVGQGVS